MKADILMMTSASPRTRIEEAVHPKVRFSSIQYHDASSITEHDEFHTDKTSFKSCVKHKYAKLSANVAVATLERVKNVVPGFDSKLNVDHQHYEQWARVPNKRVANTVLFRGIQQLKVRAKRDAAEERESRYLSINSRDSQSREVTAKEVHPRDIVLREINPRDLNQRDGISREVQTRAGTGMTSKDLCQRDPLSRDSKQRACSTKEVYSKDKTEAKVARVFLKFKTIGNNDGQYSALRQENVFQNASVDAGFGKTLDNIRHSHCSDQEPTEADAIGRDSKINRQEIEAQQRLENPIYREPLKSRHGITRLHDRSPFPVSIKQPKYHGEHVFLVSEPFKHRELPKSKMRSELPNDNPAKLDSLSAGLNGLRTKVELTEIKLSGDAAALEDELYRSKSFFASFPSKRQPTAIRTPASVPSADFCDISLLEDVRPKHSAYANLIERSRTESAFSCKNPHLLKWVPRVQRMKELLK